MATVRARGPAAARADLVCAAVYPTRSTVYQRTLPLRFLVLWAVFGRRRLRLHLHEYQRLRRLLRWPRGPPAGPPGHGLECERAGGGGIGVGRSGGQVVRRGGRPADQRDGATLRTGRTFPTRTGTIGVFGMRRDDKSPEWLAEVLSAQDVSFSRVEAGGWRLG